MVRQHFKKALPRSRGGLKSKICSELDSVLVSFRATVCVMPGWGPLAGDKRRLEPDADGHDNDSDPDYDPDQPRPRQRRGRMRAKVEKPGDKPAEKKSVFPSYWDTQAETEHFTRLDSGWAKHRCVQ